MLDMRKFTLTLITPLIALITLKADCTFESFVIGEEFTIGNMLVWTTSSEVDNKQFIIEKSIDGMEYDIIGEVNANGNSEDENTYRYMDLDARKGTSYYRIKQIDFDGDFSYSQTAFVNKSTDNDFMIASINNPLNSESVNITIDFIKDMELTYSIKDMKGDVLQEDIMNATAGLQNVDFDLTSYPNGSYKLFLQSGDEIETITIKKLMSAEDSKVPVANKD